MISVASDFYGLNDQFFFVRILYFGFLESLNSEAQDYFFDIAKPVNQVFFLKIWIFPRKSRFLQIPSSFNLVPWLVKN